ncbi:MAG: hypothetical protein ACTSQO_11270 [Candidatus Helarchaeota archaeon]
MNDKNKSNSNKDLKIKTSNLPDEYPKPKGTVRIILNSYSTKNKNLIEE